MKKELISIIIPCLNEEESIPLFYREIKKEIKKFKNVDFELIFVNDGSTDNSLKVMKDLNKKDEIVKYISFSRNFGKESAMYAGLEKSSGDYVTTMDVDLQDPPELLTKMYKMLKDDEDLDCVATKSVSRNGYSVIRKFLTASFYKIISKISNTKMVPGARDYRLMRRKMTDAIIELQEYNRYSKGLFGYVGFNTEWIEYDNKERIAGESKWSIWKLFKYAIEGIIGFSTTPLLISAIIGIIFCILSFILIIFIIIKTLVWGDPVSGWPSLACIIFFVSGIQLFCIGIMGMYLSKTYLEVKKRPIYIIKDTSIK